MNFERWVSEIMAMLTDSKCCQIQSTDVILMYDAPKYSRYNSINDFEARDDTIQIADIRLIQIMKDGLMKFN